MISSGTIEAVFVVIAACRQVPLSSQSGRPRIPATHDSPAAPALSRGSQLVSANQEGNGKPSLPGSPHNLPGFSMRMEVDYDSDLGYPKRIFTDPKQNTADDEMTFGFEGFKVLAR